jgi:hypothetical protein
VRLFSALAFLGAHKSHEFMKLRLSNLIIMAEPIEWRSNRPRKPTVHFAVGFMVGFVGSLDDFEGFEGPIDSAI